MPTILDRVKKSDIKRTPFPYVVVKNALPKKLADDLLLNYPSLDHLGSGSQQLMKKGRIPNNLKIRYGSTDILKDTDLSRLWSDFVKNHLTYKFFKQYLDLFGEDIYRMHPQIRELFSTLVPADVGVRGIDNFTHKKVLLDAEICADSPVKKTSSTRTAHIDYPKKLGVALLYFKNKKYDSKGGDFEIYKVKKNKFVINHIRNVKKGYLKNLELVARVPFEHNTLVLFLNNKQAFHGVSMRAPTNHLRYVFNVAFDVEQPLFDLAEYRENSLVARLRTYFLRLTGLHKEQV